MTLHALTQRLAAGHRLFLRIFTNPVTRMELIIMFRCPVVVWRGVILSTVLTIAKIQSRGFNK